MKMSEVIIGMKLEDERTNEVFTVLEKNSKYKTVMLEGTDGKTRSVSIATITKHFVEVFDLDECDTPVETEPVVEPVAEEPVVETAEVEEVEEKKPPKKRKRRTKAHITRTYYENGVGTPVPF